VSAAPHHGMNYSSPQQQAIYSSAVSPVHYGSPNHGTFLTDTLDKAHIPHLSLKNFTTTTTNSV
jgi:hypothetical protein